MAVSVSCHLDLQSLAKIVSGEILSGIINEFKGVGTDSRQDLSGQLFIPLVGENFDGHDFLSVAAQKGAAIILSHKKDIPEDVKKSCGVIIVKDTLSALQKLATYWRQQCSAKVVGITGSNGKTSTKEFLKQILSSEKKVCASPGSFNNHWGVPLALLDAALDDEVIILEMGMNHKGELKDLSRIAQPDLVVVTQVARAHIGHLGNLDQIASSKREIYEANTNAQYVFNLDNEYTRKMKDEFIEEASDSLTYSIKDINADVYMGVILADEKSIQLEGHIKKVKFKKTINVFGSYNGSNVAAASALALRLGLSPENIIENLDRCENIWGRGVWYDLPSNIRILFDAYNANLDSMIAFLNDIDQIQVAGQTIFILGDMNELGEHSEDHHIQLAGLVAQKNPDIFCFVGDMGSLIEAELKTQEFKNNLIISDTYNDLLALKVQNMLSHGDRIFMKASRSVALEQFFKPWGL